MYIKCPVFSRVFLMKTWRQMDNQKVSKIVLPGFMYMISPRNLVHASSLLKFPRFDQYCHFLSAFDVLKNDRKHEGRGSVLGPKCMRIS